MQFSLKTKKWKFFHYNNNSLQYYRNLKIPSAIIARLTLKLLDFDFDLVYKKDKDNKVADALSRNSIDIIKIVKIDTKNIDTPLNIKDHQSTCPFCNGIIKAIKLWRVLQINIK